MKSPPTSSSTRRRAFTLIELLVVIAIIAILASMLLPTLGKAKDRALLVTDLNNIKQVMTATHLFANDNNDFLPYPGWDGTAHACWCHAAGMNAVSGIGKDDQKTIDAQLDYARRSQL